MLQILFCWCWQHLCLEPKIIQRWKRIPEEIKTPGLETLKLSVVYISRKEKQVTTTATLSNDVLGMYANRFHISFHLVPVTTLAVDGYIISILQLRKL